MAKRSPLRALTPFLDNSGIIRVGGRIQTSHLPYNERHPVILPRDCWLSNLVLGWAHQSSLHGGVALTYSCVMRRAWIIGGRQRVRAYYVRRCIKCAYATVRSMNQLMGNLPEEKAKLITRDVSNLSVRKDEGYEHQKDIPLYSSAWQQRQSTWRSLETSQLNRFWQR